MSIFFSVSAIASVVMGEGFATIVTREGDQTANAYRATKMKELPLSFGSECKATEEISQNRPITRSFSLIQANKYYSGQPQNVKSQTFMFPASKHPSYCYSP